MLGIDYLGGANYRDVILRHHPKGFAAGFLHTASGWQNCMKVLRQLSELGTAPIIRVHGIWKDDHHFTKEDIDPAVVIAGKIGKLAIKHSQIKFIYSPWLEHRASAMLFRQCKKACKAVLPAGVRIANCGSATVPGLKEYHQERRAASRYLFSFDGLDMFDNPELSKSIIKFHKQNQAQIIFGWVPQCNGRSDLHDPTPRENRTAYLTGGHIVKMSMMLFHSK